MYDIRTTHVRDIYGKLLWIEPLREENRLYVPGDEFVSDKVKLCVERVALVDNTQHVNVAVLAEKVNIVEPHL